MVKLSVLKGVRALYRLRVRYRLMVLAYATEHEPTAAALRYGISPRTVRRWRVRWRADGLAGPVPRYPRGRVARRRPEVLDYVRHARVTVGYGAERTRLWLWRIHGVRLAMGTIQRVFGTSACPIFDRRGNAPRGS